MAVSEGSRARERKLERFIFKTNDYYLLSLVMASSLGIPVKLLHESLGHVITVELKTGQLYRGKLLEGMSSRDSFIKKLADFLCPNS